MKKKNLKCGRTVKSYSESFKLKVLREISEGRVTKLGACKKYDIGNGTIYGWIKKYNRLDLYNPSIQVLMPKDKDDKKRLKAEIKALKELLVQSQLKHLKSEADLSVALEELGYDDKEEFEKKQKANRSKKQ